MKHSLFRIAGKILLGVIALFVLLVVGIGLYITTPYFSAKAAGLISNQSGRNVTLEGAMEMHLWQREPRFVLNGVKVGNAPWSNDPLMFQANRIEFSIRPLELLRLRIVLPELIVDQPKLVLEKNDKGDDNWDFSQNTQASVLKKAAPQKRSEIPVVHHLKITGGSMTYRDPAKKIDTTLSVSTASGESNADESLVLSGKGNYQGKVFSLDLSGASVLQLRESNEPYPFKLKTVIGPTSIAVDGTVEDPVKLEAMDVELTIKGTNAADLYPITGIALPPTPPYALQGHLTRKREGDSFDFTNFTGNMGHSDLKGSASWHPSQTPPYLEAKLVSDNLDMADLSGLIGANKKPDDTTRVIPDTPLDISKLLAMNADVTFHGNKIMAPDLLDNFHLKLNLKDGVLKIEPVSFGIASGTISANLTIEGKKTPPEITLDASFNRLSLTELFQSLADRFGKDNVSAGLLGGKATLHGTGKSLRDMLATSNGTIGVGMEGGRLSKLLLELVGLDVFRSAGMILTGSDSPVPIDCVVGDFAVNDGVMQAQEFLIDTEITTVRGDGTANLRDETLDMRLHVYPKESTLLSARSPLVLKGTFKKPSPGVDAGALAARGGAAGVLALLAPPAALLAFIGPGLGDKSDCAAFISRLGTDTGATVPVSQH